MPPPDYVNPRDIWVCPHCFAGNGPYRDRNPEVCWQCGRQRPRDPDLRPKNKRKPKK